MNRSKSVVLQRNLPFTTHDFKKLKSQVTSKIKIKQRHRYLVGEDAQPIITDKDQATGPSRLQSPLTNPCSVTKYRVAFKSDSKSLSLFEPGARVRAPKLKNCPPSGARQVQTPEPLDLRRFNRILFQIQSKLCRTCHFDGMLKPKLFKRKD